MAAALVQSLVRNPIANVDTDAASFSGSTTTGNLIVVAIWGWRSGGFTIASVADNKSNTFLNAVSQSATGNTNFRAHIYYCENATGGASHQITIDPTSTGNYLSWVAYEVSGMETSSVLDQTASDGTTSATPTTGATGTLSQADEFVVAVHVNAIPSSSNITEETTTPAWNVDAEQQDGLNYIQGQAVHKIVSATTALTGNWTIGSSAATAQCIATFKAAAVVIVPDIGNSLVAVAVAQRDIPYTHSGVVRIPEVQR